MNKKTVNLIKKYYLNNHQEDQEKILIHEIVLKAHENFSNKKIINFCEKELKKLFLSNFVLALLKMFPFILYNFLLGELLEKVSNEKPLGYIFYYVFISFCLMLAYYWVYRIVRNGLLAKFIYSTQFYKKREKLINLEIFLKMDFKEYCSYYNSCYLCKFYHGKSYRDGILVCAIHPYGLMNCPDFKTEKIS